MTIGGLGSGLDFLYDENAADVQVKKTLRLSELEPNRDQPRKIFSEEAIAALADSIQRYGMLQPILVRPYGLNYQIVAGERRWRAARMLGLDEVPVIIREISDEETMEIALIENLQRENLNPLEEAEGYEQLMERFEMTQEDVAKCVGKSRSAVEAAQGDSGAGAGRSPERRPRQSTPRHSGSRTSDGHGKACRRRQAHRAGHREDRRSRGTGSAAGKAGGCYAGQLFHGDADQSGEPSGTAGFRDLWEE